MGFDITELVASLGAYHRTHEPELYSKLLKKDYSQKYFRTISGVKDEYVADEFLLTEVLQPFQKTWTPKGNAAFSPEIIKVRRIKIDMELDPVDLERTWEGERIDGSLPEGQELLEGYIYEKILVKAKKEIEYLIAFKGVYATPTAGTPGPAGTSADGLLKILEAGITANKVIAVPTGPITIANARDAFEIVFDSVDPEYQDQDLICLASPQLIRMYKRDYRAEFGPNQDYVAMSKEGKGPFIDGTNCELVPIAGMNGSSRIIITPMENLIRVIDGTEEDNNLNLRFQINRRIIDVLGDFKMGWGFAITEGLVWTNDFVTLPAALNERIVSPVPPYDPVMEYLKNMRKDLTDAQRAELEKIRTELWGEGALPGEAVTTVTESVEFPGTTHVAPIEPHTVRKTEVADITVTEGIEGLTSTKPEDLNTGEEKERGKAGKGNKKNKPSGEE